MSNPIAYGKCQLADPCPDCASGRGHPMMLASYDPEVGQYRLTDEEEETGDGAEGICTARRHNDGSGWAEGDICGSPATCWAGDVPLCPKHYRRLKDWIAGEDEIVLEARARAHEAQMREQEELNEQAIRLDRRRDDAACKRKAARSVVYYVRRVSDGMIKIGYSASLHTRTNTHRRVHGPLQVLLVHGGDGDTEHAMHNKFGTYQIGRTEWFRPVRPLLEWICGARENHTHPHVQPADVLPIEEIRAMAEAAPPDDVLRWDDNGVLQWPPDIEAA